MERSIPGITLTTGFGPEGMHVTDPEDNTDVALIVWHPGGWTAKMLVGHAKPQEFLINQAAQYWVLAMYMEYLAEQQEDEDAA